MPSRSARCSLGRARHAAAAVQATDCEPYECIEPFSGTYRFASSQQKPYIVLYEAGDWVYSFQYELAGDDLSLRATGTSQWFTLERAPDALALDEGDNAGTFDVTEGDIVVLKLPSNPSTGYDWVVTATTETFGYPTTSWDADFAATGSGGTSTFTWQTTGWFSIVGTHSVTLEYRRPTGPVDKTFMFTVNVVAP